MSTQHTHYEIFVSYARKDNVPIPPAAEGWVTALRNHIIEEHRTFSTEPLRIFFDVTEIKDMEDWRHRILGALRHAKILLICLSPHYFKSAACRWEWDEYVRRQVHQHLGADSIATVYFVEIPGSGEHENARWLESVLRGNYTDIRPWFPEGAAALQREEVRRRLAMLGQSLWERIDRARRAGGEPGNLRRQNPYFVGRADALRQLHEQLAKGAVGLVTAVHGLGGQGKTELAVAYAHGWADAYPVGLWVLAAEGKKELLPLIGELAYAPELGYQPTEAERKDANLIGRAVLAELLRRAEALKKRDAHAPAAALLILDNVSEAGLLSAEQLATLPRADWLRIIATTRLDAARMDSSRKNLAHLAVDSLAEEDALALVRDHQSPRDAQGHLLAEVAGAEPREFTPKFISPAEEAAARELVRELGGFTLAVEQVAVHLGLHPEITPSAFLNVLRERGLPSVDRLGKRTDVQAQMRHQEKQLAVILEATLGLLDATAQTALQFAALLPPDNVPWPWLQALTLSRHPELAEFSPDDPDPWLAVRRQLEGLRLLIPGDHPVLARLHRLVAAHLRQIMPAGNDGSSMAVYLAARAWKIYKTEILTDFWELDALELTLPSFIPELPPAPFHDLVNAAVFLSEKVVIYRSLREALGLLEPARRYLQRLAAADPSNAGWQRDLSVSQSKVGDMLQDQGDLAGALSAYRESLAVSQRLAATDPSKVVWQEDLIACQSRFGGMLQYQGDFAGALSAYREGQRISQRLLTVDPSNAGWQRSLGAIKSNLGDVLRDQGDLAGALLAYREGLTAC